MSILLAVSIAAMAVVSALIGRMIAKEEVEAQRERQARKQWDLYRWEQELINTAELRGCPSCSLLRRRADLQGHAPEG
ncbi:hypothetical protein ACFQ34_15430 [Pseudonocardia benzenivorans]|jgi:hypothetical protein|uniref:Uncharacterized protein n=2 Tax=Pseudonocardia TaxID=1847 RepID=F4CS68_PSEUX|nr:hypothetical protein [Pseudonocardia dioxanivorans]AEA22628.1 hypothetical protein Psed_0355 [Pseudonocardia dioxanivorans CB1190]GJF07656.1 hypothetical protein PSD17_66010 [Pseudonocardia sp. D17]